MSQTASEKSQTFTPSTRVYMEIWFRESNGEILTIDRIAEIFTGLHTRREVIALVDQLVAQDICVRSFGDGKPTIKTNADSRHGYRSVLEDWKIIRKATLNIIEG